MLKESLFIQTDLFGTSLIPIKPTKKIKSVLSEEEKIKRKEKSEAHTAWKLLKSRKFKDFSERHKYLLKKYYRIEL
jgi:hypothetical protein